MSRSGARSRLTQKDRVALGAAVAAVIAGALIWAFWVLPVAASVERAQPQPLGRSVEVELAAGERAGIWASGISSALGTIACTVTGPDGAELPLRAAPSLVWDDTLWWMTPRRGFEQIVQVTASGAGVHAVRCVDSLDTYDGEFLVAADTFGGGEIGLGRGGGAGFAVGTVLAFCAVVLLPFGVLLPVVIGLRVQAEGRRDSPTRRQRSDRGSERPASPRP